MQTSEIETLIIQKLKGLLMPDELVDNKTQTPNSQLMSVSIRGWITLIVVFTVCLMSIMKVVIVEPLYTMTGMIIAFYFGQNTTNKTNKQ